MVQNCCEAAYNTAFRVSWHFKETQPVVTGVFVCDIERFGAIRSWNLAVTTLLLNS